MTYKKNTALSMGVIIVVLCTSALISFGGDMIPPLNAFDGSGNPVSIMKSMNQIEPRTPILSLPYVVSNAGSYYLAKNMMASNDITGITVLCSDVQIDLSGFALIGTSPSQDGIKVVGSNENITIYNGSIRQWQGFGINGPGADDGTVEKIKANRNGLGGIYFGNGAIISLCSVFGNGYGAPLPPSYHEPTMGDQDYDGMDDNWEQQIIDADPNDSIITFNDVLPSGDFDNDGADNWTEWMNGTDPTDAGDADADMDGLPDAWEQQIIAFVPVYTSVWNVLPSMDDDSDTVSNMDEFMQGTDPTNAASVDADFDGMNDLWEMRIVNDNPGDGLATIYDVFPEMDYDMDGASNIGEYEANPRTDPVSAASVPPNTGTQTEYASYTNPPSGPMFDNTIDPTDEPSDDGIRCGGYSTIKECKSRGNRGSGIYVLYGTRIIACTASGNMTDGIHVTDYCSVLECLAARNRKDGITLGSKCRIQSNNCGQNGDFTMAFPGAPPEGAGIRILGNGNRIEDNNVSGNALGIQVDDAFAMQYGGTAGMSGGGNLIMGNSSVDNWGAGFDLAAGDFMGGAMGSNDYSNASSTNTQAAMDPNNPFSNFNY